MTDDTMISTKPFKFKFEYNKTFALLCANNGDGKTMFLQKFILAGIAKDKVHVLNTSREKSWNKVAIPEHIYLPRMYNQSFIDQFVAEFATNNSDCVLVLSDADAYKIKSSDVLYKFVREARHMGIGLVLETAMLQQLPRVFFQQSTYSFFGPQEDEYNIRYISKANIPIMDAEKLLNMEKYTFGCWDRDAKLMYFLRLKKELAKW